MSLFVGKDLPGHLSVVNKCINSTIKFVNKITEFLKSDNGLLILSYLKHATCMVYTPCTVLVFGFP